MDSVGVSDEALALVDQRDGHPLRGLSFQMFFLGGGWGLEFWVWGLGFRVWCLGFEGLGFRVWGLGFRVWGLRV